MSLSKYFLILLIGCFLPTFSFSQLGPHPSNIKWQQINTDKVRVIFPKDFEQQGLRVVNIIHKMDDHYQRSIGDLHEKINIVLHNRTTIPNGFVGVAPFRSEFFATPPQSPNFLGTVDWLDALTIHEYRHVQQYANTKVGLSKLMYFLQGDNGWGLAAGAAIPNWFWEGDATIMETALTKGGRGRAPFFTLQQRAILAEGKDYTYQKARNGSFKDLVPNHYRLGYTLLMYGREKYGNDFWKSIFSKAASYQPLIYPFSNALKKSIGLSTKDLYQKAYDQVQSQWEAQREQLSFSTIQTVPTKIKKTVTSYRFPFPQGDGSLICWKASYRKTDALVRVKEGKEKVLTNIGFHTEKYLSVIGNKAVWTEYEQDQRRTNKNYSNIVLYDLQTKRKTRLTTEGRYFSPSFSYSQGRIVTVHVTPNQENTLLVLDANTGTTLKIIPNPNNYFISFPKWAENDTDIIFIAKNKSQIAIFQYNLIENQFTQLTNWTHHTIADLFIKNQAVYFTASFSGIDNIYKIDLNRPKVIEQLTSVPIGAYYPSVTDKGNELIFSEFTEMGYELSQMDLTDNTARRPNITLTEPHQQPFYAINEYNEEGGDILSSIPDEQYPIKAYKGLFKGMKLHSWNLYPSVSLPTLEIQFDNYLNDFSVNLTGGYNLNENAPVFVSSVSYGKWYPQLTAFTSLTNRSALFIDQQDSVRIQAFDQFSLGGQASIPLNWVKDNFRTNFTPFAGYVQRFLREVKYDEFSQPNETFGTLQMGLNFSTLRRTALQNVGPRWGFAFNVLYQQRTNRISDRQVRLGTSLFLPGIGANHNLRIGLAYQKERLDNQYQFSDSFEYPRGFAGLANDEIIKWSADYQFPIAYPDWGFWGITYFKRIRLNTFFDYSQRKVELVDLTSNHNSVGVEIIFDNQFWNELPVTFGLRNSFLLTGSNENYDFGFFVRSFIPQ